MGLSGTDPQCNCAHGGPSSGSGTGCVHGVGSEADFPGGKFQARPARREGHMGSLLCPGTAYCAARSAPALAPPR